MNKSNLSEIGFATRTIRELILLDSMTQLCKRTKLIHLLDYNLGKCIDDYGLDPLKFLELFTKYFFEKTGKDITFMIGGDERNFSTLLLNRYIDYCNINIDICKLTFQHLIAGIIYYIGYYYEYSEYKIAKQILKEHFRNLLILCDFVREDGKIKIPTYL